MWSDVSDERSLHGVEYHFAMSRKACLQRGDRSVALAEQVVGSTARSRHDLITPLSRALLGPASRGRNLGAHLLSRGDRGRFGLALGTPDLGATRLLELEDGGEPVGLGGCNLVTHGRPRPGAT